MNLFVLLEALSLMAGVGLAGAVAMTVWLFALTRLEAATVPAGVPVPPPRHYRTR